MGVSWTDEQRQAIDNRGGTLLVSAAAGSGKTAVLVQRVLDRVTDSENPCDVDSFLIVTFTKAAASEMRGKSQMPSRSWRQNSRRICVCADS